MRRLFELEAFHFFHPDRPPVTYKVEIGKVVEKADVGQCSPNLVFIWQGQQEAHYVYLFASECQINFCPQNKIGTSDRADQNRCSALTPNLFYVLSAISLLKIITYGRQGNFTYLSFFLCAIIFLAKFLIG